MLKEAIIFYKTGLEPEVLSNLLDFGSNSIIPILIPSNSMELKIRQAPIAFHLHLKDGLKPPMLLELFQKLENTEALLPTEILLLNLPAGFRQNLSFI